MSTFQRSKRQDQHSSLAKAPQSTPLANLFPPLSVVSSAPMLARPERGTRFGHSIARIPVSYQDTAEVDTIPTEQLSQHIQSARGQGYPLQSNTRRTLEQGLRADLSAVRVHTDSRADTLARTVNARAFTTGADIFFRQGLYRPDTTQGLQMVAHEATHTVQQAAGPVAGTPIGTGLTISDPSDGFERAATTTAARITQAHASQQSALAERVSMRAMPLDWSRQVAIQRMTDYKATIAKKCGMPYLGPRKARVVTLPRKRDITWHATFYPYENLNRQIVFDDFHITSERGGIKTHHHYTDDGIIPQFVPQGQQADFNATSWGPANRHAAYIYTTWLGIPITKQELDGQLATLRGEDEASEGEVEVPEEEVEQVPAYEEPVSAEVQEQRWREWYAKQDAESIAYWKWQYALEGKADLWDWYEQRYITAILGEQPIATQPTTEEGSVETHSTQPTTEEGSVETHSTQPTTEEGSVETHSTQPAIVPIGPDLPPRKNTRAAELEFEEEKNSKKSRPDDNK